MWIRGGAVQRFVVNLVTGWLFLSPFVLSQAENGGICWMQYSMADNNLYSFLIGDINEMQESELIKDPSLTFWLYVDGNEGYSLGTKEAIKGAKFPDGSSAPGTFSGVRYLTWDQDMEALVQTETLDELNSDTPAAVAGFLEVALADCVAKGKTEFMFIMSSHGSGFGFGGDEELPPSRRKLVQANQGIVAAIRGTLDSVEGAPDKLDLLAFDACLQASLESLKDYQPVTKYYMASEATEPGVGYPYHKLTPQSSVMDIAKQNIDEYVSTPDTKAFLFFGKDYWHSGPKTLALFDMGKVDPFYDAWENLSAEIERIMATGNNQFYSALYRIRSSTASFGGAWEVPTGNPNPVASQMDIGNFLDVFSSECNPSENTTLFSLISEAQSTYNDMILKFEKGPSTTLPATGMAAFWLPRESYEYGPYIWKAYHFNETDSHYNLESPNFTSMLLQFVTYDESPNDDGDEESICGCPKVPRQDGQLMWSPLVNQAGDNGGIGIEAAIADAVDSVLIEFGVDVSHLLGDETWVGPTARHQRKLQSKLLDWHDRVLKNFHPTSDRIASKRHLAHPNGRGVHKSPGGYHRRVQESEVGDISQAELEDYFIIFGGLVYPEYGCGKYDADWDKNYYILMNSTDGEPVDFMYVYRGSDGKNTVPVLYFPESTSDSVKSELQSKMENFDLTIEEAEALGGEWSTLEFTSEHVKNKPEGLASLPLDLTSLYTPSESGLATSQTDISLGGFILPVLYVESQIQGRLVDYMVGGFLNQIIDWKPNITLGVEAVSTERTAAYLESNSSVIDLAAFDYAGEGEEPEQEVIYFVIAHGEDGEILTIQEDSAAVGVFSGRWMVLGVAISLLLM